MVRGWNLVSHFDQTFWDVLDQVDEFDLCEVIVIAIFWASDLVLSSEELAFDFILKGLTLAVDLGAFAPS